MGNLRKKNQTETQNTVEGHSRKLKQMEDKILELRDKIEIKRKSRALALSALTGNTNFES
jgi:hypothetical protein